MLSMDIFLHKYYKNEFWCWVVCNYIARLFYPLLNNSNMYYVCNWRILCVDYGQGLLTNAQFCVSEDQLNTINGWYAIVGRWAVCINYAKDQWFNFARIVVNYRPKKNLKVVNNSLTKTNSTNAISPVQYNYVIEYDKKIKVCRYKVILF